MNRYSIAMPGDFYVIGGIRTSFFLTCGGMAFDFLQ
jgi:hypothetical protein